jgi:single-strand DNA-binding protein
MSEGMNRAILYGNLGADPELRQTQSGSILKMRLATTEVYFDKDQQKQERTDWHNVTVFGRRADGLAKVLSKGARILVSGRLQTSSYEKDGQKHYRTEVVANDIFLGGGGNKSPSNGAMLRPPLQEAHLATADLPF